MDGQDIASNSSSWPTIRSHEAGEYQIQRDGSTLPTLSGAAQQWPTATTQDSEQAGSAKAQHVTLNRTVVEMWPTPNTAPEAPNSGLDRGNGVERVRSKSQCLAEHAEQAVAGIWPTPNAQVSNDGETPETWQARADKIKEQGINGNGAGTPLAIAAQQWQSPAAGGGGSVSRGGDRIDEPLLAKQAEQTAQWATPRASMTENGSDSGSAQRTEQGPNPGLKDQVKAWATPSAASDANGCSSPEKTAERHAKMPGHKPSILREQVELSPIGPQAQPTEPNGSESSPQGQTSRPRLNPEFVRWLMGFPPGWVSLHPLALTNFEHWVMASFRLLARLRS